MAYSAAAVANAFIDLSRQDGKWLTNMHVQKLVYIAHGWCLALLNRPLVYESVQAWQWGPVIPRLYEELKKYGAGEVTESLPVEFSGPVEPLSQEMGIIRAVWKAYGKFSAMQLSAITHKAGTPWQQVWSTTTYGYIPDELIREHYLHLKNERTGRPNT